MKKLIFLAGSLLLAGCGDNASIQQVKDMVTFNDNTITVGNAFDHRSLCEKVSWETGYDERQRDIVRYTCKISPDIANQLITLNINKSEQQMLTYLEKQTRFFNDENKHAQLARFYLQNGEKGLQALSDSGIPLAYNQLKNELLQYVRDNYRVKEIKDIRSDITDFELPSGFFKKYNNQRYITQLKYNGYPASPMDEIDLTQDTHITDTIQKLISMEQQALDILAGNNTDLDMKNDKGAVCDDFDEKFPCGTKRLITQAFSALFFKQTAYNEAIVDIQKQLIYYEQVREAMDQRDTRYAALKDNIQQYLSTVNQQSQLTQLEQVVDFSIIKDQQPTVASCDFVLTSTKGNTFNFNLPRCFRLAYESEWNGQFEGIIQSYYQGTVDTEIKAFIQQIDSAEKALRRVE